MSNLLFQSCKLLSCNVTIRKIQFLFVHKMTQSFPPLKDIYSKTDSRSLSQKLMLDYGIISHQHNGIYALLPLGLRAVEKLMKIIDLHMTKANCKKLKLPHLTSSSLWKISGRLDSYGSEIFHLNDRHHHEFILNPTHEESITYLMSSVGSLSHANLPVRLYQITTKFRDEQRLKHGLMRGREFLMKDLYTFDKSSEDAKCTYKEIVQLYIEIFNALDIPVEKVQASVGSIGGTESHEFHVINSNGEDTILSCTSCSFKANAEMIDEANKICPHCKGELINTNGIEVGQSFLLGTKYSAPMSAHYKTVGGETELLYMGCYGIGVTRLLAAGIECLSKENRLTWPAGIAPYKICIIPPKKGSKEDHMSHWSSYLANVLNKMPGYEDEIIMDDRLKLTIGHRLNYAKRFGFPVIIVIGKTSLEQIPRFEVLHKNEILILNQADMLQYLRNIQCERS